MSLKNFWLGSVACVSPLEHCRLKIVLEDLSLGIFRLWKGAWKPFAWHLSLEAFVGKPVGNIRLETFGRDLLFFNYRWDAVVFFRLGTFAWGL